jgi:hypothetical protein
VLGERFDIKMLNVPVQPKIGRRVESPSSRSTADSAGGTGGKAASATSTAHQSTTNIQIHNHVGAARSLPTLPPRDSPLKTSCEPAVLDTPKTDIDDEPELVMYVADSLVQPPPALKTSTFDGEPDGDVEELADNVALKRFRQRQTVETSFVVDVSFLRHVIATLIRNHNITTTNNDLRDILAHFGDVELRTQKQVVKSRSTKKSGMCGCADVDMDDVIEIVGKVLVNGVNLAKNMPAFLQFLVGLGLSI